MATTATDTVFWARLMGQELERAELQPLRPEQGGACPPGAAGILLVGRRDDEARALPVRVKEHSADVLGPRFVDELRDDGVVRHAIPGPAYEDWNAEALAELEASLCGEPFRIDPAVATAEGDDWVAWMTRDRILGQPAPADDSLHERLVADLLEEQRADGSWGSVAATGYAILRLLKLGVTPSDERIQRAAGWLLDLPEPPPRPGMWMLTQAYQDEWVARREPKEDRELGACEIIHTGPDEDINFFSWGFPDAEQDQFRAQECQRVIPTCARHHPPACEPRITHISALVADALLRCGFADHPRLRRYVNTVFHLGGAWGYWCGCGALGYYDPDIPASEEPPNFGLRAEADDGAAGLWPLRWVADTAQAAHLANQPAALERGTHLEPFSWYRLPGNDNAFAVLGTGWQNGDCWAKTNRALAQHPACPGSLVERQALFQASRYQNALGEWDQGYPAGMLAFLSLYGHPAAKALALKTVPWLREHQADDGLWHHEELHRNDWGKPAHPAEPRLATYHIAAALHKFGLLARLRP